MNRGPLIRSTPTTFGASNWHARILNAPYRLDGFTRQGIDCFGLVRLVYRWRLGIAVPRLKQRPTRENWRRLRHEWKRADRIRAFDVVLFRAYGAPAHVGIAINDEQFIHSAPCMGVTVGRLDSPQWASRAIAIFRHRRLA